MNIHRRRKYSTWVFSLMLMTASAAYADSADDSEPVSYQRDILPRLMYECSYCHQAYDPQGFLIIDEASAYSSLVNVSSNQLPRMKRIEPGKPEQSYVWLKGTSKHIAAGGKGWNMPVGMGMPADFADQLYRWIKEGAKKN